MNREPFTTTDLFNEVLCTGLNEKVKTERRYFIEELLHKVEALEEADIDCKTLMKDLKDYLNEIKLKCLANNRYM